MSINSRAASGSCANAVTGKPIPRRASNCKHRNLSRAREIATLSFKEKTPIISNCRTTAVPKNVCCAPIRGMIAS